MVFNTADFLIKKKVQNHGELPKYYVTWSHEGIVSKEVFDLVQAEIASRKGQVTYNANIFSGKVVCGKCGSLYAVDELERELDAVCSQIAVSKELYSQAVSSRPITDGSKICGIQDIYMKWLDKKKKLEIEIARRKNCRLQTESICKVLSEAEKVIDEFSPFLFLSLVEKVIVYSKDDVRVVFKDGREVRMDLFQNHHRCQQLEYLQKE